MKDSRPEVAMVICVRNEEELLPAHLTYHHALGVTRAYVFLDRCEDRTRSIVDAFPWAQAIEADLDGSFRFLTSYQRHCADRALALAREEGFDWLLHVDADEFARGENNRGWLTRLRNELSRRELAPAEWGSLRTLVERAKPETEAVVLQTKEVIPLVGEESFWRQHHFQSRPWLRREILDPIPGEVRETRNPMSHGLGKSLVRTGADVQAFSSHAWTRRQGSSEPTLQPIPSESRGCHYHFAVTGARHWLQKYRKLAEFPDHWENGRPRGFPKQCWSEASVRFSEDEAHRYYDRWVALPREELSRLVAQRAVERDSFVEDVLRNAGFIDAA